MLFAPECSRLAPPGGPRCSATSNRSWPASTSRATTRSCRTTRFAHVWVRHARQTVARDPLRAGYVGRMW